MTAYGGIASANSAVLGSKGLCNSSSLDLLDVSTSPARDDEEYSRIKLASRIHRTTRQLFRMYRIFKLTKHKAWRID
jgi:hypothetical protein